MKEEEALVRAFVVAAKREWFVAFLSNPRRRADALSALNHFADLDARYVVRLDRHDAASVERALRARGAGADVHAISDNPKLDGKRLPLRAALDAVIGCCMGTLLSSVPGRLAFFEGEGPSDRCILSR